MEHWSQIDWQDVMERVLIEEKGEPIKRMAKLWQWQGTASGREESVSFHYSPDKGTWRDWSVGAGGGVYAFFKYFHGMDKEQTNKRLRAMGYPIRKGGKDRTDAERARWKAEQAKRARQREQEAKVRAEETAREKVRNQGYAARLWNEAKPIAGATHPARQWASKLNLLHPWVPFPTTLRWHGPRGCVVAAATSIKSWVGSWPGVAEVCGVALVAINQDGEKRLAFRAGTSDKKSHGPLSAGVVAMGAPTSERVVLVEGIKDMLAVYSHSKPCAVLATITTLRGCLSRPGLVDYLRGRVVELWTDTDAPKTDKRGVTRHAGQDAGRALQDDLIARGIVSEIRFGEEEGTDPGDWARTQRWPDIGRSDFDTAAADLRETWPECEAARRAIHASSFCTTPPAFRELTAAEIEEHVKRLTEFQGIDDLTEPCPQRGQCWDCGTPVSARAWSRLFCPPCAEERNRRLRPSPRRMI